MACRWPVSPCRSRWWRLRRGVVEHAARSLLVTRNQRVLRKHLPALAVAGELDEKYAAISTRVASITPRIRAAVVPGAGHNVRLEAPETYCALLKHFLDARQEQKR